MSGKQDFEWTWLAKFSACLDEIAQYPKSALQEMRRRYEATRDVDLVHQMLQEQFESFLRDTLQLSDTLVWRTQCF